MSFTLNFRNILDLYGFQAGDIFDNSPKTLEKNANIFIDALDTNGNGVIDRSEYEHMLNLAGLGKYISDNIFDGGDSNPSYDTDSDGSLSNKELVNMFKNFDDGDNIFDFSESLEFFNQVSNSNIDTSTSFNQYKNILSLARGSVKGCDTDSSTKGKTTIDELGDYFKLLGIKDDNATAEKAAKLFDKNEDGEISLEEYLETYLSWDTDGNGYIDCKAGEASDYMNILPDIYRVPTNEIEQMAQNFIRAIDRYDNMQVEKEEYKDFITKYYGLSESMAEAFIDLYAGSDGSISFNELVSVYSSFDADGSGDLNYEEMIEFQNSLTDIKIDSELISETQYAGLYQMAASVIRSIDDNIDGEITVEEYRAALNAMYSSGDVPLHAAENFIRMLDMDKNGTVNILEAINKYAEMDADSNGYITADENADFQAKLKDSTLYDTVNDEIIDKADRDKNSKISLSEFKAFLKENKMSELIADEAFKLFDRNADGELSRLELMEAFSRYDNSVENLAFIEKLEGSGYVLYEGDGDNELDPDERLKFYEDLAG